MGLHLIQCDSSTSKGLNFFENLDVIDKTYDKTSVNRKEIMFVTYPILMALTIAVYFLGVTGRWVGGSPLSTKVPFLE